MADTIDTTQLVPTVEDIQELVKKKLIFDQPGHGDNQAWLEDKRRNFYYCPWGISWDVSCSGKHSDVNKALRLFCIAILINWPALVEQLTRTLHVYRVSKSKLTKIINEIWQPNMPDILGAIDAVRSDLKAKAANNMVEAIDLNEVASNWTSNIVDELKKTTPYMLRNDGTLLTCGSIHPYIKTYYEKDLIEKSIEELLKHPEFLEWFYENTLLQETRNLIGEFLYKTKQAELIADLKIEKGDWKDRPLEAIFLELNDITNQEFCRVRTSNFKYKYGGDNGEIYFRISSKRFNWFDLIWMTVNQFKDQIKYVTVLHDFATTGEQFVYVQDGKHIFNKMPIEEFLTLGGNPVIETLEESIEKHDDLNPALFENGVLKEDIKKALHRIATEFCDGLHENGIKYKLDDIVLTGSNASYNYTDKSDIDLHLRFDTSIYDDEEKQAMAAMIYDYAKKAFNIKYTIKIAGIPVEVYAETNY